MEWGQIQNFNWFWAVPAVVAIFIFAVFRRRSQIKHFGDPALVEKLIVSLDVKKRVFKRLLSLLALGLMIVALCQPHFRTKEVIIERTGIDVMILIDVSKSMLATDIKPTRLDKARLELQTLVEKLKQDRIGIVGFAGDAFIQCPLTLDRNAVKLFLSTINPNLVPTPGTAIGRAIQVGIRAFVDKEKAYKAMILLTDGEDHDSDPLRMAKEAAESSIRIFTIGIGTSDGATLPMPDGTLKKDKQGRTVVSRLDEDLLKKIADETGGKYYRSTGGEIEIEDIEREIRQMTQKGLKKDKSIEYEENYQLFLLAAILFLLAEMMVSEKKKTKVANV